MQWRKIGQDLFYPTAVSTAPHRITVFGRNPDAELIRLKWMEDHWASPENLGVPVAKSDQGMMSPVDWQIAASRTEQGRIELYGCSVNGDIVHSSDSHTSFSSLGAPAYVRGGIVFPVGLAGPPAACGSNDGQVEIFVLSQGGEVLQTSRKGREWSDFETLGVPVMHVAGQSAQPIPVTSSLAACRSGQCIALFLRTTLGALLLKWWDGNTWSDFASLGMPEAQESAYPAVTAAAPLTGPPAACSWAPRRLDVFARGPRGDLAHKAWQSGDWGPFESLGMPAVDGKPVPLSGAIAACSWGVGRIDVFLTGCDRGLYQAWWDANDGG